MRKYLLLTGSVLCIALISQAQVKPSARTNQFVDLTATIGSSQGAVASAYVYNWKLGQKKKWEAGLGLRWTSYFGSKKEYTTALARLARNTTFPFVIVFAGQKIENWDTLTVQRPFTNSINFTANFGYNFNEKWNVGFNIDLIGYTFGRKGSAILTSKGVTRTEPEAKPAAFNILLTGDNDYGSLNSAFFLKYQLNNKWGIKGVYQFIFTEYKTKTIKQTAPDGTIVDRFRNKANTLGLGLSYHF